MASRLDQTRPFRADERRDMRDERHTHHQASTWTAPSNSPQPEQSHHSFILPTAHPPPAASTPATPQFPHVAFRTAGTSLPPQNWFDFGTGAVTRRSIRVKVPPAAAGPSLGAGFSSCLAASQYSKHPTRGCLAEIYMRLIRDGVWWRGVGVGIGRSVGGR